MKFRDPVREENYTLNRTQSLKTMTDNKNAAHMNKFNILTHEGPPRRIDLNPQWLSSKHANKPRDWNILSHLKHEVHEIAPVVCSDTESLEKLKRPPPVDRPPRAGNREFNILNNDYRVNNTARKKEEYELLKSHVLDRYWRTHDYDFIKMQYCDPRKEDEFRDQREHLRTIQGSSQLLRVPPRYSTLWFGAHTKTCV
jgi:hypothetical protein